MAQQGMGGPTPSSGGYGQSAGTAMGGRPPQIGPGANPGAAPGGPAQPGGGFSPQLMQLLQQYRGGMGGAPSPMSGGFGQNPGMGMQTPPPQQGGFGANPGMAGPFPPKFGGMPGMMTPPQGGPNAMGGGSAGGFTANPGISAQRPPMLGTMSPPQQGGPNAMGGGFTANPGISAQRQMPPQVSPGMMPHQGMPGMMTPPQGGNPMGPLPPSMGLPPGMGHPGPSAGLPPGMGGGAPNMGGPGQGMPSWMSQSNLPSMSGPVNVNSMYAAMPQLQSQLLDMFGRGNGGSIAGPGGQTS